MTIPAPFRVVPLRSALAAAMLLLSGCGADLEFHTGVQDCNGTRYVASSGAIVGNGGDTGRGNCVLRNGVMPQPQEFD